MPQNVTNPLESVQPLFLCLGVRKAATTWIHRQLEAHPEIACTTTKETGYWMGKYDRGPEWYVSQFQKLDNARIYAEATARYLHEKALARMAENLTDVRFMVILRNPYDRTFSEYLHRVRNGERISFRKAVESNPGIVERSRYATAINCYLNYFTKEQLHVAWYEDLLKNRKRVVRDVYHFIGVDDSFVSSNLETKVNVSRSYSLSDHVLKKVEDLSKSIGLQRKHLVQTGLAKPMDHLYRVLARRRPAPKMTADDRKMLDETLQPEIIELQELLGLDLSHWLP